MGNLNFDFFVFHAWFQAAFTLRLLCIYNFRFTIKLCLNLKFRFDLSTALFLEPLLQVLLGYGSLFTTIPYILNCVNKLTVVDLSGRMSTNVKECVCCSNVWCSMKEISTREHVLIDYAPNKDSSYDSEIQSIVYCTKMIMLKEDTIKTVSTSYLFVAFWGFIFFLNLGIFILKMCLECIVIPNDISHA